MSVFKENFQLILETIIKNSKYTRETVLSRFEPFKKFNFENFDDKYLFQVLSYVPFYAGMDSKTVTDRRSTIINYFSDYNKVSKYDNEIIEKIMSDTNMIRHEGKIRACIYNAKVVSQLVQKHGSFKNYLSKLNFNRSPEDLEKAALELQSKFKWLKDITSHHFLTDIGAKTVKPDRVIMRVLTRLKLVENETCFEEARKVCNRIVEETGYSHRYVDIVIVKFGHRKDDMDTGIVNGICLEGFPRCENCLLKKHCCYKYKERAVIEQIENKQVSTPKREKLNFANNSMKIEELAQDDELDEFEKIEKLRKCNIYEKKLLAHLFQGIKNHKVEYSVKLRKDAVALTLKRNKSKNLTTIWLYKDYFRILVLGAPGEIGERNKKGKKCSKISDINEDVFKAIQNKYDEIK